MPTYDHEARARRDAAVNRANADNSVLVALIDSVTAGLQTYRCAATSLTGLGGAAELEDTYTKAIAAVAELRDHQMRAWSTALDAAMD